MYREKMHSRFMTLSKEIPDSSQALKGLKIVVTAYNLEQSEHRGIAVYTKALIRNLKESGAEVWLLTEFDFPLRKKGLNKLPQAMQKTLQK